MPYTRTLTGGRKESYEIKRIQIDLDNELIHVDLDHIEFGHNNIPRVESIYISIRNQNEQIVDPDWDAPEGFNLNNPDTWGDITSSDIPFIDNPAKQFFNSLVNNSGVEGVNLYEKVKNALYKVLQDIGSLPSGSDWSLS